MLLFSLLLAAHVPTSQYLTCSDFDYLSEALQTTTLFTPAEKVEILSHWAQHTNESCFDNKDAND